jgi:hypothetical protein
MSVDLCVEFSRVSQLESDGRHGVKRTLLLFRDGGVWVVHYQREVERK